MLTGIFHRGAVVEGFFFFETEGGGDRISPNSTDFARKFDLTDRDRLSTTGRLQPRSLPSRP